MANADVSVMDSTLGVTVCQEDDMESLLAEFALTFEENRRKTFADWPFDEPAKCTADAVSLI